MHRLLFNSLVFTKGGGTTSDSLDISAPSWQYNHPHSMRKGWQQDESRGFTYVSSNVVFMSFLKKDFIDLFLERGEGRKKRRETSMYGCLLHAPYWGPGLQPRPVP